MDTPTTYQRLVRHIGKNSTDFMCTFEGSAPGFPLAFVALIPVSITQLSPAVSGMERLLNRTKARLFTSNWVSLTFGDDPDSSNQLSRIAVVRLDDAQ